MASKITGAQLEYDANAPLIDVDTALEDLAEDLQRAGRTRQLHALRHVCSVAQRKSVPWRVFEQAPEDDVMPERNIESISEVTHVIVLEPVALDTGGEGES